MSINETLVEEDRVRKILGEESCWASGCEGRKFVRLMKHLEDEMNLGAATPKEGRWSKFDYRFNNLLRMFFSFWRYW